MEMVRKGNHNGRLTSVIGDKLYQNIVGPHGLGRSSQRGQILIELCEGNGLVTKTWFKKPREDCTPGKHQKIEIDINYTMYL
jgi:hypothetical protein